MTSGVSHLTCWCWAVPDPAIGQRPPALQGLLGFHGWRSCGQTVVRRWSPHRSPPHPSSLTRLTIAGPARHMTAALRRTRFISGSDLKRKGLGAARSPRTSICTMDCLQVCVDMKKVTQWHPWARPALPWWSNPWLIYFNLTQPYRWHKWRSVCTFRN